MKICHINLAKGFRGGERQTLVLIEHLSKTQEQVVIVRKSNTSFIEKLRKIKNLKIINISKPFIISFYKIKKYNCDLIHAHEAKAAHFSLICNLFLKIPYIITRRVTYQPKNNFLTSLTYRKATKIVALSTSIKNIISNYDQSLDIEIIPDASSQLVSKREEVYAIRNRFSNKFLVGHVGALVDQDKGQSYIIKAAHQLKKDYSEIVFLLIGDGRDEKYLKKLANGNDNIIFIGFVNNVGSYLSALDIFLFPSLNEGFGSSIIDAMEFKKPIIAAKTGGITDLIEDNHNGVLINKKSTNEITSNIINLYRDENLRRKLSSQAKIDSSSYHINKVGSQYLNLYQKTTPHL